jgi:alpha-D-xyloside xylohydrolase
MGDVIQSTAENQKDLTLFVYEGKNGSFEFYEDEGVNYNYEKGMYATIPFSYDEPTKTLTIGERKGDFPGMEKERIIRIVWVNKDKPAGIDRLRIDTQTIYNGQIQTIKHK